MLDSKKISVNLHKEALFNLYGIADENLRFLERLLGVEIVGRNDVIIVNGRRKDISRAERVIEKLKKYAEGGKAVSRLLVEETVENDKAGDREPLPENTAKQGKSAGLLVSSKRDLVRPKRKNQEKYIQTIFDNQIVFGIGPA
ncbi:MAG TPA: hypothetical protein PKJ42_02660, partial [Candidatus Goldiibacteriota bacterium]|nr:hypothetical protein [Candidatus Goldiibacteriota bacterium]